MNFLKYAMLFVGISHAEIPFEAIKGIHETKEKEGEGKKHPIFDKKMEHLSPINGFFALKTGALENLRFFGNYEFGWGKEENRFKRIPKLDRGKDGITKLTRILFPSTGGTFTTTSDFSGCITQYMTPKSVGILLAFVQDLRKGGKTEIDLKTLLSDVNGQKLKNATKDVIKDLSLQTGSRSEKNDQILTDLIFECLNDEKCGKYPQYMLESVILGFFWSHFNEKRDIKALYDALYEHKLIGDFEIDEHDLLTSDDVMGLDSNMIQEWNLEQITQYPTFPRL
jgi:hypothetical protein